jgi:hypothetical protein
VSLGTIICNKRLEDQSSSISLKGGFMNTKLQDWLHDLGVALGLIERPKLQPIPVRTDDKRRRQPQRR